MGHNMDFTVENAGTTIACREFAEPGVPSDTPALVCVHGACVDGTFFDGIARELACGYRVIAYDRRGCGESGDAADGRYDLAAQAADLQAVIEHVGAPANVLAHSAGTLVTLELSPYKPGHCLARDAARTRREKRGRWPGHGPGFARDDCCGKGLEGIKSLPECHQ